MDRLSAMLARLQQSAPQAVAVISSPPPKRDDLIRAGIRREPHYIDLMARLGTSFDDVRVASERLRIKLWRLHQDCLAQVAREHGAVHVPAPAEGVDADGFLRPEYAAGDATHANYQYGAIAIAKLKKAFSS